MQPAEDILETYRPQTATGRGHVRFVPVWGAMTVFVAGAALLAGTSMALQAPVLGGLILYACFAGPLCLAAILSRVRQLSQASDRTVSLKDGDLTVTTSRGSESHPLTACCWFRGQVTDEPDFSYHPIRRKAIIIVFPTGREVACGLDDAFYARWLNALRSSQCRQVLRQEGALGSLIGLLAITGLFLGGFLGWRLGRALQDMLFPQLANNQFSNIIPAVLAIVLAWALAISPWFIPGWRRHTTSERQQFIQSLFLTIVAGAILGGNLVAGIVLATVFAVLSLVIVLLTRRNPASAAPRRAV